MRSGTFKAVILDLDGVVTRTAHLHARAWKQAFDPFLEPRGQRPFDLDEDYRHHVDGKPRYEGARSFLRSRGIDLPEGAPDDSPDAATVSGLGNRKNQLFQELLRAEGAQVYEDAIRQIERWKRDGLKTALITSSRNGGTIVDSAGLGGLFDVMIDGVEAAETGIRGKPAPDVFIEAARRLGVHPGAAVVIEDAVAGVQAGMAGGFGLVVGVARDGAADELRAQGADTVVHDLTELDLSQHAADPRRGTAAAGIDPLDAILDRMQGRRLALFLDYDGTLTPIVPRPEDAVLSEEMRALLEALADQATVAIVSGRDLADVETMVGLDNLHYAGSHGFDIVGPDGLRMQHEGARESLPELDAAEEALREHLAAIEGAHIERKRFAIAVHYRQVANGEVPRVEAAVDTVAQHHPGLRKKGGKKIFELQPDVDWHKGRAVLWLLEQLGLDSEDVLPVYIGDDVTDEDAFEALQGRGLGIRIGHPDEPTAAEYTLRDTEELQRFFGALLEHLTAPVADRPHHREMYPWELVYRRWEPAEQPLREALCALGNGRIVTRGAFEEAAAGGPHYPGTYLAGGYNRLDSEVSGRVIENEDLVNWPNWLPLTFRPKDGEWLDLDAVEILEFEYRLDLRRGLLVRRVRFRDRGGRESRLVSRRVVSMAAPHLAGIEWTLKPLNWSGEIEVRSALDGSVVNDNVPRYRGLSNRHLELLGSGWDGDDAMYLTVRTNQSHVRMTQAARTRLFDGAAPAAVRRERRQEEGLIAQHLFTECEEQKALRVEKIVALRTSFDAAISEPEVNARQDIRRAPSFAELLEAHETKWRHLWSISDIEFRNGEVQTQLILRLHLFHLLQTVSPNTTDRDVGVPARGWHGEAYRGHIFWDEVFIFPLIVLRIPELARSLLMYRYRRLPEARHMAREAGFAGAMYPWQSGSDGREESQVLHLNPRSGRWLPDTTYLQRHVNAAIAYTVWQYYQATGDVPFLAYYGAEMIIEIARFWASIATYDAARERYVIHGVVGPDEFHTDDPDTAEPGLRNNAYTNVMAAWTLRCAGRVLDLLDQERRATLAEELHLRDEELLHWQQVSTRLLIPFHEEGLISQFEGYEKLQEFDWDGYRKKYRDIHRLDRLLEAEGDDINRYKASKQADVLMLFFLFSVKELEDLFNHMGYEFSEELIDRNVAYYMNRTSHGSTLSNVVHSWVMARRDRQKAWSLWQAALRSDIDDIQGGTTPEGIHLGAMAGTVDLIHRGHTGMVIEEDVLWFDPMLPEELADVRMRMRYRGHGLTVEIMRDQMCVTFDRGPSPAVRIGFCGEVIAMRQGETRTFDIPGC